MVRKSYPGLERFRLVAAVMVIAIHTYPLLSFSEPVDLMVTRVLGRLAVPFFFMLSGFFVLGPFSRKAGFLEIQRLRSFLKKNGQFYLGISLLYLPLALYSGWYTVNTSFLDMLKIIFFDGTFYHLWYLPSLLMGMSVSAALVKRIGLDKSLILAGCLYLIGLMRDSYSLVFSTFQPLFAFLGLFSTYTRNGLFFAPVFLLMGAKLFQQKKAFTRPALSGGLLLSIAGLLLEGGLLHLGGEPVHDSMYLSLLPASYFLFQGLLRWQPCPVTQGKVLSMWLYFLHPLSIVIIRLFAKVSHLENWLIDNSFLHFIAVLALTVLIGKILIRGQSFLPKVGHKQEIFEKRAWKECSAENLLHNLTSIQQLLQETKVMAVLKDDGYGHGAIWCARVLGEAGVDLFAVATFEEGKALRMAGIPQDILVLGYTSPSFSKELSYYNLIQTVVNQEHGQQLMAEGVPLRVHIKIDTGMHRLGFQPTEMTGIIACYRSTILSVEGIFSHLGSADSLDNLSEKRTRQQIAAFNQVLETLESAKINPGLRHLQSSYGVVNYPELDYDYARIGIMLYGSHSQLQAQTKKAIDLKPVMAIKSRIIDIKQVAAGELIGYGNQLQSGSAMTIAIVSVGYGDGLPRGLSNQLRLSYGGQELPQIGNICMDMLIVDVTAVEGLCLDSEVTIIGPSLRMETLADKNQTLTNELYSRLSPRISGV